MMDEPREESVPESNSEDIVREIGHSLAEARNKGGRSIQELAGELKITSSMLSLIEAGEWDRLGPTVYARGYVTGLAALLDVDISDAKVYFQERSVQVTATAELLRTGRQKNWVPYQRLATYVAATALVAIPAIWVGKAAVDRFWIPLVPVVTEITQTETLRSSAPEEMIDTTTEEQPLPVMASMAPRVSPLETESITSPESELADQAQQVASGQLELILKGDAWLQVEDAFGTRLAFDLMPAGSSHLFAIDNGLIVRIGNAGEVQAILDGEVFDMAPYVEDDLAKFELPARSEP
jgi:cytoskeleton protein RodZ